MSKQLNDQYINSFYDQEAVQYDQHRFRDNFGRMIHQKQADALMELLASAGGRQLKILEAGCGTGRFLETLHQAGFTNLTGLDQSSEMLSIAQAKASVAPVQGDVYAMPFADNTFDVVYSVHVIMHLEDPRKAVAEMLRVSKKYVILEMTNYHSLSAFGPLVRKATKFSTHRHDQGTINPKIFTASKFQKLVAPATIVRRIPSYHIPSTGGLPRLYKQAYGIIERVYRTFFGHHFASQYFVLIQKNES
ncbi:MAG: class I SAM-dependent methyltransferase [Candidatus Kerfeldbacteria bacterium]|nr:class I SAM-dependent methyltransferase [Candidatus Kerfeldbacteria bacterium]